MVNEKKRQRIIFILQIGISVIMIAHLVSLHLCLPYHSILTFIGMTSFGNILFIIFNTISAFIKKQNTVIGFVALLAVLLIVLFIGFYLTLFVSVVGHFDIYPPPAIPMDSQAFIILSYAILATFTIGLSIICILLSIKKKKKLSF